MRARLAILALVATLLVLPSAAGAASPQDVATAYFWSGKAKDIVVWLANPSDGTLTGTFRFYSDAYVFSTLKRATLSSGGKARCAIAQITYGVNPTKAAVLVCNALKVPAGAKLALDLAVKPAPGFSGQPIADYDFGGSGLPRDHTAQWQPGPLPDFTLHTTWRDKKAGKLELTVKNVGDAVIGKVDVGGSRGLQVKGCDSAHKLAAVAPGCRAEYGHAYAEHANVKKGEQFIIDLIVIVGKIGGATTAPLLDVTGHALGSETASFTESIKP